MFKVAIFYLADSCYLLSFVNVVHVREIILYLFKCKIFFFLLMQTKICTFDIMLSFCLLYLRLYCALIDGKSFAFGNCVAVLFFFFN